MIVIVFGKHLRQNRPPLSINAARQQPVFVGPDAGHWGTHRGLCSRKSATVGPLPVSEEQCPLIVGVLVATSKFDEI
jgi:hypothetical protein